jgi:pyridoxal phosphate enzyme (YggS family)
MQSLAARTLACMATKSEAGVAVALKDVIKRVDAARQHENTQRQPRLVAVSKTKPVSLLQEAYDAGQRVFGENYVQELVDKQPQLPDDIQWHFIGHLQSKKSNQLLGVTNLAMVETVDSEKLANKLDNAVSGAEREPLNVMVQVNTSGEESKFGVQPEEAPGLAQHIQQQCKNLRFRGLMTIGMADYTSRPENFQTLRDTRAEVCKLLGMSEDEVELSMGMSGDFEQAIKMGSTNVRVGSTIFGARNYDN